MGAPILHQQDYTASQSMLSTVSSKVLEALIPPNEIFAYYLVFHISFDFSSSFL